MEKDTQAIIDRIDKTVKSKTKFSKLELTVFTLLFITFALGSAYLIAGIQSV